MSSVNNEKIIRKKIKKTIARAEGYPLLEVIINDFHGRLAHRLRHVFGQPVEMLIEEKGIKRFGEYFDTLMFPAVLCIFEADTLSGKGLVFMEGRFMEDVVEMLLGFPNLQEGGREARAPTSIDKMLVSRMVKICLDELSSCMERCNKMIGRVHFKPTAVESSPQMAVITAERTPCYVARFNFDIGEHGYGGRLDVVLPIPLLAPVRRYLTQTFRGDVQGDDAAWKRSISYAVSRTPFVMRADLEAMHMTVAEISRLKPGMSLPLHCAGAPKVSLVYEDREGREVLAKGRLGIRKGYKAVKIEQERIGVFTREIAENLTSADLVQLVERKAPIDPAPSAAPVATGTAEVPQVSYALG